MFRFWSSAAADRLASESYQDFYQRQQGLKSAVLRFFNIFGPRPDSSSPYLGDQYLHRTIAGEHADHGVW